ncbi:ABC transporter permease [Pseudactinotalea terrae]|uniref:ABC transporter permease n=1 Tax=Pseudactinotalea terrae TaxID=1743262 RepID=UPI001F502FC2|nr:ABC transporter permease [Pseudactinotalea terrae]
MSAVQVDSHVEVAAPPPPGFVRSLVGYGVIALVAVVLALTAPSGISKIQLTAGSEFFQIPQLDLPAALAVGVPAIGAAVIATVALVTQLRSRSSAPRWMAILAGTLLLLGFLAHLVAGKSGVLPLTGLLTSTLFLATPLIFGALGGVVCERVGIVNIAIEGQLLAGAFAGVVVASIAGQNPYVGLITAPIAGVGVGALLAWFSIRYRVDQVITGVVLNVLVLGLTTFFFKGLLSELEGLNDRSRLPVLPIPLLSEIPVIGPVLFRQTLLVYLLYVIVILLHIYLFRSRWGLRVRSVGEHPKAADTVGIDVNRTRWRNTLLGSGIAGLGGAFFTIGQGLAFGIDITAGSGFIALAALILGRWTPLGAVAAALFFGFANALSQSLRSYGVSLDSNIPLMIPYIVTLFAVAGFGGKVRPPAAEGTPYVK